MAVPLVQWESIIAMHVNGAPLPAIEDAARHAAIEFCQRTRVDLRVFRGLDYYTAEPDMILPQPDSRVRVASAINVWGSCGRIDSRTRREIDERYPEGFVRQSVGRVDDVWGWISLRPGLMRLVPAVSIDLVAGLDVEAAMQPRRDAREVEDFLFDAYGEDIGWGALERLHLHVSAPYAVGEMAAVMRARFDRSIDRVMDKHVSGHNKPRLRTGRDEL